MIPSTFGGRLAAARKARKLTQEELAAAIGLAVTAISGWENDRREPEKIDTMIRLSQVLDVSIDYLLTGRTPDGVDSIIAELRAVLDDAERVRRGGVISTDGAPEYVSLTDEARASLDAEERGALSLRPRKPIGNKKP